MRTKSGSKGGGDPRRRRARDRSASGRSAGPSLQEAFGEFIPPEAATLRLPSGYSGGLEGIMESGGSVITSTPLLSIRTITDVDRDQRRYEVCLIQRGEFRRFSVAAQELRDTRQIIRLVDRGVDVTSRTAGRLVDFVAAFLRENLLPMIRTTQRLGWREHEGTGRYLLARAHPEDDRLEFADETADAKALRAALIAQGTLEGVRGLVEELARFPLVLTTLCAGLAPAVRECLRLSATSAILHLVAPSSTGKTVAQRVALSAWADPFSPNWMVHGHATFAGIEGLCLRTFGLPVLVEDLHLVREEDRQRLIYAIGNERWKARGGDRRQGQVSWQGWLITSGEQPLIHATSLGGEAARVLTLSGPPFGVPSEETRRLIDERILPAVQHTYALLGPALVDHLLGVDAAARKKLHALWTEARDRFALAASRHPIVARQGGQWALLDLTARMLSELLGLDDPARLTKAVVESFEVALAEEPPDAVEHAYELVLSWAEANRAFFYRRGPTGTIYQPPGREVLGLINEEEGWIGIHSYALRRTCYQLQLGQERTLLRAWRDRGYLDPQGDRLTRVVKVEGRPIRLYVLHMLDKE